MNRIEEKLKEKQNKKEKAFITYITAGFPNFEKTKEVLLSQQRAKVDIVELGIPFSDPIADGPVIQNASYQAILNGTSIKKIFPFVKQMREEGFDVPLVFMLYYNTILTYGVEAFVESCRDCGVDGLIIPDLPFEEQEEINQYLIEKNETILIQLISPVSKGRIPEILENAKGFVYCVSSMGVTGGDGNFHKEITNYLSEVKQYAKIPIMMGFGIKTAKDVIPFMDVIDGAIVGTHFIQLYEDAKFDCTVLEKYSQTFLEELNRA